MHTRGFISIQLSIFIFIAAALVAASLIAFGQAQALAHNQERISDIKQIQTALKIYFTDNGFYPPGNGLGGPSGMNNYLNFWPTPPQGIGSCSKTQNIYSYAEKSSGTDYELSFCLGTAVNGLSAGIHTVTAAGIQ